MTTAVLRESAKAKDEKLPLRDWILLPLLSLLTIAGLILGTNSLANQLFQQSSTTTESCLILNDPSTGVRGRPNTVCRQKIYESQLTEYRFNNCGHRAGMECGPKPPGTYRIVMIGSSFNYGMWVPREKSFAALLPEELTQLTGRKVELYNEAMQWGFPPSATLRFKQVFPEQPDMILWVLTPTDISKVRELMPYTPAPPAPGGAGGMLARNWNRAKETFATRSVPDAIAEMWNHDVTSPFTSKLEDFRFMPAGIFLEHLLYTSRSLYLKSYMMGADSESGFLRSEPTQLWQSNLAEFDRLAGQVEGEAKAAGIPFVAVLVPERAQAAMISMGDWPAGYDPFKLDNELRSIIESHGGTYFDVLPEYRQFGAPEKDYFPVDGHPDAKGHAMISELLAKGLTDGPVPALRVARGNGQQKDVALDRSR